MKGTVHITDYAQSSLGDVVFVELPTEGTEVSQGGTQCACLYYIMSLMTGVQTRSVQWRA